MISLLATLIGAGASLAGIAFGSWFSARRSDHAWLREQKLRAAVNFITAAGQLYDFGRGTGVDGGNPGRDELTIRMQEGRSALYLLCDGNSVDLVETLARRVLHSSPDSTEDEHAETIEVLRRLTRQLRHAVVN